MNTCTVILPEWKLPSKKVIGFEHTGRLVQFDRLKGKVSVSRKLTPEQQSAFRADGLIVIVGELAKSEAEKPKPGKKADK